MFKRLGHNPDVLSCLANLSSDEVFTPPRLANAILDLLPESLWSDLEAKFLDPASKSGVFLREIARRLLAGLEEVIPDRQERINHIFGKQLYGLAITELTALLSRRSLYCSKQANGDYSVCETFRNEDGNILFERIEHTWQNGRCSYCGASESEYARGPALETHAYAFIHMTNPEEVLGMKFDVIISNPPYHLSDAGYGTSATPIYHKFVYQARKLEPRYLTMIIPARWFSGGKGLDDFRNEMLHDNRIRQIVDYPEAVDVFPGVQIKGGVCYFLWDRDNRGSCLVTTSRDGEIVSQMERPLLETGNDTFIRYNEAIPIYKKAQVFGEPSLKDMISSSKPFGLRTYFRGKSKPFPNAITLYQNGGVGYVKPEEILSNLEIVDKYKVLVPPLGSGSDSFPHPILGKPFVVGPNSACTETYLVAGAFDEPEKAGNLATYLATRFLRFLVLLNKPAQHATSKVYKYVPVQDFSESWSDEKLYAKYGITEDEIAFIESMVRPMELNGE
jgi:site-specific DNA-methyltransferase (adenine-specific)